MLQMSFSMFYVKNLNLDKNFIQISQWLAKKDHQNKLSNNVHNLGLKRAEKRLKFHFTWANIDISCCHGNREKHFFFFVLCSVWSNEMTCIVNVSYCCQNVSHKKLMYYILIFCQKIQLFFKKVRFTARYWVLPWQHAFTK